MDNRFFTLNTFNFAQLIKMKTNIGSNLRDITKHNDVKDKRGCFPYLSGRSH